MPKLPTAQLVTAAYTARQARDRAAADLAEVEAEIIARGPGRHTGLGESEVVTVVAESTGADKHVLQLEDEDKARALAKEDFAKVFDRHVLYTPCKSFADVVGKILSKTVAAKLLALCTKPGQTKRAHCRYA